MIKPLFLFGLISVSLLPHRAYGQPIADKEAILSIIGEAEDQGYKGMCAVAHAIRNRGTLNGVYGLHAKRVVKKLYSPSTYHNAELAWIRSKTEFDFTLAATHWEAVQRYGFPSWARNMVMTIKIKDHSFFKVREV